MGAPAKKRVLLLGDERKGQVRACVVELADRLRARGHVVEVVMDRDTSLEDRKAELVVVFGGDGSMLAAARRMGTNQVPTLGINFGRLGFLTAFGADRAFDGVEAALLGKLVEEPRLMLECSVSRADGAPATSVLCLNDGVLSRRAAAGMVTIRAFRTDRELAVYTGDGVIVATPVGSTAYSLSAGGPVLSPRLDAIVITPLAPHTLTLRPLVIPVGSGLFLEVLDAGGSDTCAFNVDGQIDVSVRVGDRVSVRPAPMSFRHMTRGPASFFEVLREKFGWSEEPRTRNGNGPNDGSAGGA